jgi:hypothetical protein
MSTPARVRAELAITVCSIFPAVGTNTCWLSEIPELISQRKRGRDRWINHHTAIGESEIRRSHLMPEALLLIT